MKKYYDPENTPLKFHEFFIYLSLPLGLITSLITTLSAISKISVWGSAAVFDIGIGLFDVIFAAVMFVGLLKRKSYGWIAVIIYAGIMGFTYLSDIVTYWASNPEFAGSKIPMLIYMILVAIYYFKRKAIFFNAQPKKQPAINTVEELRYNDQEKQLNIKPVESESAAEVAYHVIQHDPKSQNPQKIKIPSPVLYMVIGIVLVVAVVFAVISQGAAATSRAEASSLKEELQIKTSEVTELNKTVTNKTRIVDSLESRVSSLEKDAFDLIEYYEKADFMDKVVVIVPDDGSNLYHKYGCSKLKLSSVGFWVYNSEAAKSEGYRPCSYCNN